MATNHRCHIDHGLLTIGINHDGATTIARLRSEPRPAMLVDQLVDLVIEGGLIVVIVAIIDGS